MRCRRAPDRPRQLLAVEEAATGHEAQVLAPDHQLCRHAGLGGSMVEEGLGGLQLAVEVPSAEGRVPKPLPQGAGLGLGSTQLRQGLDGAVQQTHHVAPRAVVLGGVGSPHGPGVRAVLVTGPVEVVGHEDGGRQVGSLLVVPVAEGLGERGVQPGAFGRSQSRLQRLRLQRVVEPVAVGVVHVEDARLNALAQQGPGLLDAGQPGSRGEGRPPRHGAADCQHPGELSSGR